MDRRSERQLERVAELAAAAEDAEIEIWLRGGWALDFFLGEVTRPHEDVDAFAWAADADRLVRLLRDLGWSETRRSAGQLDLTIDGVELHLALLERRRDGAIVTSGQRWSHLAGPPGMLDAEPGRIGEIVCRIVAPAAQLEIKETVPALVAGRRRRAKDLDDLARLREALGRR